MKIIKPDVQFITPIDGATILKRLEQCGRVCYKSEDKITEGSAEKFVAGIIKRGHEAVLEHCSFTVKFICDRGVSHEIVRHRLKAETAKAFWEVRSGARGDPVEADVTARARNQSGTASFLTRLLSSQEAGFYIGGASFAFIGGYPGI